MFCSDECTVGGPPLSGQQEPGAATTPRPDPWVATSTMPGGSDGNKSTLIAREASTAASTKTEKAASMRMIEEATVMKAVEGPR
jgi:hypothetical protein